MICPTWNSWFSFHCRQMAKQSHILITGQPGIGKTTLIKKLAQKLPKPLSGFYTEEVRDSNGRRIGFDVVSIERANDRKPLARDNCLQRGPKVGKYTVLLSEFESIAIPCLDKNTSCKHIIIDEIGKNCGISCYILMPDAYN